MTFKKLLMMSLAVGGMLWHGGAQALDIKITPEIESVKVKHGSQEVDVVRKQDEKATINPEFAKVARKCPPFCAQPMEVAPGVKTYGEVEVVHFMATKLKDGSGLLVDARTPDWHAKGTIPGSISVPYTDVNPSLGADPIAVEDALKRFGAVNNGGTWDFSKAKTLVLWCNGPWCGQSPHAIKGLMELGYPVDKLVYYRGGMQEWEVFGLTVSPPAQ